MKQANSLVMGMAAIAFFSAAACSRKVAAVSKPPNITPVATPSQQPARAQARTPNAAPAPNRQVAAQQNRPATMPPEVRKRLSDELARLEDALFDYDQSTIRSDASVALRDDVNVIRGILADYPNQKLVIEGHTDERGSAEYNIRAGRSPGARRSGIPVVDGHSGSPVGRGQLWQGEARVHGRIRELLAEEPSRARDRGALIPPFHLPTHPAGANPRRNQAVSGGVFFV